MGPSRALRKCPRRWKAVRDPSLCLRAMTFASGSPRCWVGDGVVTARDDAVVAFVWFCTAGERTRSDCFAYVVVRGRYGEGSTVGLLDHLIRLGIAGVAYRAAIPAFGGEDPLVEGPAPQNWHHEGLTRQAAEAAGGWST